MQALMSGVNNYMGSDNGYKISKYLSIGEDNKEITMGTIIDGIKDSGMLPRVSRSGEMEDNDGVIYKIGVQNHLDEMKRVKRLIGRFICECFDYCIENYPEIWEQKGGLIRSPRGAYAFVRTLGELNYFLTKSGELNKSHNYDLRFEKLKKYLDSLFKGLKETKNNAEEYEKTMKSYGGGNKKLWNHLFTSLINRNFTDFTTPDYEIYLETQDVEIQAKASKLIDKIEKIIRERTLKYIYALCGGKESFMDFDYNLFKELRERAEKKQMEYKKNFAVEKEYSWDEMFYIVDYRNLSKKGWGKELEESKITSLYKVLSIRMDKELFDPKKGINYYKCGDESNFEKGSKWMVKFNIIRSNSAHTGSRNQGNGINKQELKILDLLFNGLSSVEA